MLIYRNFFKRIFDFFLAIFGLLILSPFFVVLFIILAVDFKGSPFFFQLRPGEKEKLFKVMKFNPVKGLRSE